MPDHRTPAKNHRLTRNPQAALARLIYGQGATGLDVGVEGAGRTLTLALRGSIVAGEATRFFARLLRFAMSLPIVGREAVVQLEGVRDIDFAGYSCLAGTLPKAAGATPLTVVLPRTLLPPHWLHALAQLTSPRTLLEQETDPTVTLQFGGAAT